MENPYIKLLEMVQGRYGVLHAKVNGTGVGEGDRNTGSDRGCGSDRTEGKEWCEFPTALRCRINGTVSPLGIYYREVFIVLSLIDICRLWNPLPQGQGITYLYTYSYICKPSYQITTYPQ